MTQNPTSAGNKKISNYIMTIVVIVLALSIVSIILAVIVASNGGTAKHDLTAGFLAVIGVLAVTMSMFTLYQSRRQAAEMKIEVPKVMTTIECKKCGTKTSARIPTRRLCL